MWLAGNAGGLVVAVLVQALVHHPLPAFLLLAACGCAAIPLVGRLRAGAATRGVAEVEVGV